MALTNKDRGEIKQIVENALDTFKGTVEEIFIKYKSEFFEKIDPILKEVQASREEREIVAGKLSNHDDRIEKIENKLAD